MASEATKKWNGLKISEVVGFGHVEGLGCNLRGLIGAAKVQDQQWTEKTERLGREDKEW